MVVTVSEEGDVEFIHSDEFLEVLENMDMPFTIQRAGHVNYDNVSRSFKCEIPGFGEQKGFRYRGEAIIYEVEVLQHFQKRGISISDLHAKSKHKGLEGF